MTQVYNKSTRKQPGCKKGAALFKMASVKKVLKSNGALPDIYAQARGPQAQGRVGGQEIAVMV